MLNLTATQNNNARKFGIQSLYGNETSKQFKAMNQTMTAGYQDPKHMPGSMNTLEPINISGNQLEGNEQEQAAAFRTKAMNGTGFGTFGKGKLSASVNRTTYQDPYKAKQLRDPTSVPTLEEMQQNHCSITSDRYNEIMNAKPYEPRYHNRPHKNATHTANILATSSHFFQKATNQPSGNSPIGEIERFNRYKYGVKKPANVWKHEMDDTRITGEQIRINNFKSTLFDHLPKSPSGGDSIQV